MKPHKFEWCKIEIIGGFAYCSSAFNENVTFVYKDYMIYIYISFL